MRPEPDIALLPMLRESVVAPGATATRLLAWRLPLRTILEAMVLVAVIDAILAGLLGRGTPLLPGVDGDGVTIGPMVHALILIGSLILSAGAIQTGGQLLGGMGSFREALLLMTWLEVLSVMVQVVQLVASLILPPLAGLVGLAGLAVLLWCLVHFVRALHRFDGWGRTLGTLVLAMFAAAIAVSIVAGLFVGVEGAGHV
ncbi:YIP1 family protein [Rubellimicrobium sp. CFH 75288]|uniref:YIP1 family protein n=1 Tax=Rubellimicrobium sp. CFH 75288 TaxID=2697034 RepID=UPI00141338AA|nr:YIP1 family protein [Rubellimicrobium sp. CFH 75288]NAZ36836.1 hypothetical protein [Rubellimicrobium sp. CFH 75288]